MPRKRGKIYNRLRARQIKDFSGLRFGNITPTDIDGMIEYHNKAYLFIELKHGEIPLPYGQILALERLTDDLSKNGKKAVCLVGRHNEKDPEKDINVAEQPLTQYYTNNKWFYPQEGITIYNFILNFIGGLQ